MKKTAIIYGKYTGVSRTAVDLLTKILLDITQEYPACISAAEYCEADFVKSDNVRYLFVGTKENNPLIREKSDYVFSHKEEYRITVVNDEVMIEGSDEGGMLYGCVDFYDKYLLHEEVTNRNDPYFKNPFEEKLADVELVSHPDVKDRGIWTWGHVIFHYKDFIDNMVRCKMNTLIVWDDFVPVNAREMVAYAHDSNVKVIWGYAWLWDTDCSKITRERIDSSVDEIAALYEEKYAHLGGDGVYFQSFTELGTDTVNGMLIAEAVTDFVNTVSGIILNKYPELELQFGLHATSVNEKLEYIRKVDKRVRIVWEDCGAFPFAYVPSQIEKYDETVSFTKKLTNLRSTDDSTDKFGVVLKGFTNLDWRVFEHQQGRFVLGASSKAFIEKNVQRKKRIWKYVQAYWLSNADKAYEMIRCMQADKDGNLCITALIEDGMFESHVYFPVALYGEMLWDCAADLTNIVSDIALRNWVEFV